MFEVLGLGDTWRWKIRPATSDEPVSVLIERTLIRKKQSIGETDGRMGRQIGTSQVLRLGRDDA